ncbi:MAG: type I restriction enzyme R subunit [Lentisphaeria bacterium]|jgi:type I restriction enzyme R subunit
MESIYAKRAWSIKQKKWLDRLAKQLVHEVIIDKDFINDAFAREGGYKRFDNDMEGELPTLLDAIKKGLWSNVSDN